MKFGPDFKGLPFENHEKEAKKLSNRWNLLHTFYEKKIRRQRKKKDEKSKLEVAKNEEKLKNEIFLSPAEYPGLLGEFSSNPPRLPHNPP